MKKFSQSFVYWLLCLLCCIGIVKAFSVSSLCAFSHSLDMHAREDAIEDEYKKQIQREADERKRIEEEKTRKEEEKKIEERRKAIEEEKIRREEEEEKAQQEWEDSQR